MCDSRSDESSSITSTNEAIDETAKSNEASSEVTNKRS